MRAVVIAAMLVLAAPAASAQGAPKPPNTPAPRATENVEVRQNWCTRYVTWVLGERPAARPPPADQRPTRLFEVEFNSCVLDPRLYERDTRTEAQLRTRWQP